MYISPILEKKLFILNTALKYPSKLSSDLCNHFVCFEKLFALLVKKKKINRKSRSEKYSH